MSRLHSPSERALIKSGLNDVLAGRDTEVVGNLRVRRPLQVMTV